MALNYTVSRRLQALLAGLGSRATRNVTYNQTFQSSTDGTTLPANPEAIRLSLVYDKTAAGEFNVYISNVDGSSTTEVTMPR